MAQLHYQTRIQVRTRIRIPNPMATLYCAEHVHIAQTRDPLFLHRTGIRVRQYNKAIMGNEWYPA